MMSDKKKGLMERWANQLQNKATAWSVVILTIIVAVISGVGALQVERDDDLLRFLTQTE